MCLPSKFENYSRITYILTIYEKKRIHIHIEDILSEVVVYDACCLLFMIHVRVFSSLSSSRVVGLSDRFSCKVLCVVEIFLFSLSRLHWIGIRYFLSGQCSICLPCNVVCLFWWHSKFPWNLCLCQNEDKFYLKPKAVMEQRCNNR